jgi:diguanylate cyclase (GGDEF)-like protein
MGLLRHRLFVWYGVVSLIAIVVVDHEFSTITLEPLVAIPLLVIAYYGGFWPGALLAILAAAAFGYTDFAPHSSAQLAAASLPINTAITAVGFCAVVVCAALLQRESRLLVEMKGTLGAARLNASNAYLLARADRLTGLTNRRGFDEELERLSGDRRVGPFILAVLFLDLDGLKQINDVHGHKVGDVALQAAARRITASVRVGDIVARIGGDEFVVLCTGAVQAEIDANRIAQTIHAAFAKPVVYGDLSITLSASIGIGRAPEDGTTAVALLRTADQRMYDSKAATTARRAARAQASAIPTRATWVPTISGTEPGLSRPRQKDISPPAQ